MTISSVGQTHYIAVEQPIPDDLSDQPLENSSTVSTHNPHQQLTDENRFLREQLDVLNKTSLGLSQTLEILTKNAEEAKEKCKKTEDNIRDLEEDVAELRTKNIALAQQLQNIPNRHIQPISAVQNTTALPFWRRWWGHTTNAVSTTGSLFRRNAGLLSGVSTITGLILYICGMSANSIWPVLTPIIIVLGLIHNNSRN